LRALALSGVLLAGLNVSPPSAVAQETEKADEADKAKTPATENESTWTSETYADPDVARERALQRYNRQNPAFPGRVSGEIRLPSGEVPVTPVEIFVCGQPAGSTDKKGRFNVAAPPRTTSGFSERCRLSIQYAGAKPLSIGIRQGRSSRLGVLILEALPGFEGSFTSATTMEASKAARRAYQKGVQEESKRKPNLEKARMFLEEAVAHHPSFAEALTALGRVRFALGDVEGAALALETSIAADEKFPPPYILLLRIRMKSGDLRPAAVIAAALLRLNPGNTEARYLHAVATFGLQRYDEAANSASRVIDTGDGYRFPQSFLMLGEIHADRGEIAEAARNFRSYVRLVPNAAPAQQLRRRLREWENAGLVPPEKQSVLPNWLLSRDAQLWAPRSDPASSMSQAAPR